MNIQSAMKETGKALHQDLSRDVYVEFRGRDNLYWWAKQNGDGWVAPLDQLDMLLEYIPYHPKEEIRPKKAGELWESEDAGICFIFNTRRGLQVQWGAGEVECMASDMIHGKDGWKRLHPTVPNENEIVIENVDFVDNGENIIMCGNELRAKWGRKLRRLKPITMILIPKEKDNE